MCSERLSLMSRAALQHFELTGLEKRVNELLVEILFHEKMNSNEKCVKLFIPFRPRQ